MGVTCPKCRSENPETKQFCADCGTPLSSSKDVRPEVTETVQTAIKELTTGSTFAGRYQVIEELGHGGMGRVYKAYDTKIKEKVALKLIKPEVASNKETIERFNNELRLARQVRHKNVCGMFDLGEAEGVHFITMEYVSGQDLRGLIRQSKQLTVGTAVAIAKQICEGLGEAHRMGIIHRDLKPSNIIIDKDGNAKIMDFGIARSVFVKGITGAGVMIGTPEYMSPEQVEGKEVDSCSDIYSLGIVLYEMLTGRVPFDGDTPFTVGVKQKSELPKDPRSLNAQIPADLGRLVLKCMEKDKTRRPQSADELKADLEKIEKGLPTTERIVPERKTIASREVTVTLRLRKLFVPALAALAVVIAGLFLWHPWSRRGAVAPPPSGKPSIAVVYFENDTGDEKLDHWRKGISDLLITDLTQSKYLKVLGGDRLFTILSKMGQLEAKSFSSEVLKEVAAQGGVDHIARGSYSKAGDILRIDLTLQDARSGEAVATHRAEGKGEESIFAMVDELTKWAKTSLNLSAEQVAGDINTKIGQVTTSSPEAYKLYSEGRQVFAAGQYQRSIEFWEKAIALDPGFALAYSSMGMAYSNMGKPEEAQKYSQEALRLSDRLPEREKLRIRGAAFLTRLSTYDQAIAPLEKLVSLYPDSAEASTAHVNLGVLYLSFEEWDKSIEHFEAAIKAGRDRIQTLSGLSSSYMAKGEYQKAKEILEESAKRFPDDPRAHWWLGMLYAFQGQFDLALNEADKAAAIDPIYTRARCYHLMWDFAQAEESYKKWLGFISQTERLGARKYLEYLYRTLGRFEEAKGQIRLGLTLAEQLRKRRRPPESVLFPGLSPPPIGKVPGGARRHREIQDLRAARDRL